MGIKGITETQITYEKDRSSPGPIGGVAAAACGALALQNKKN